MVKKKGNLVPWGIGIVVALILLNNLGYINLFAIGALSENIVLSNASFTESSGKDYPAAYIVDATCAEDKQTSSGRRYTDYSDCELKPLEFNKVDTICLDEKIGSVTSAELEITYTNYACYDSDGSPSCYVWVYFYGFDGTNYVKISDGSRIDTYNRRMNYKNTFQLDSEKLTQYYANQNCFDIYTPLLYNSGDYGVVQFTTKSLDIVYASVECESNSDCSEDEFCSLDEFTCEVQSSVDDEITGGCGGVSPGFEEGCCQNLGFDFWDEATSLCKNTVADNTDTDDIADGTDTTDTTVDTPVTSNCIFSIGDFCVNIFMIIIAFGAVGAYLYFGGKK